MGTKTKIIIAPLMSLSHENISTKHGQSQCKLIKNYERPDLLALCVASALLETSFFNVFPA
jgi:hypothetical protein